MKTKVKKGERVVPKRVADKIRKAVQMDLPMNPDVIPIRAFDANGTATPLPGAVAVAVKVRGGSLRITTTPDGDAALLYVPGE